MKQYTNRQVIMVSDKQLKLLEILRKYNVNVSNFIRIAIREKLQRDWKIIKEKKTIVLFENIFKINLVIQKKVLPLSY